MDLPDLTVLGYSDRRQRLRMIRVAERSVEVAPASLDKTIGYASMTLRDGWIAVDCHQELWSVPLPITAPGHLVARGLFDFQPSLDPANFWLAASSQSSRARVLVEVDRHGRALAEPIPVADRTRLEAVTPMGLVIHRQDEDLQLLQRADGASSPLSGLKGGWRVAGVHDSTLVVERRSLDLAIVDLRDEKIVPVERPGAGAWGSSAVFSPDGMTVAIDVRPDPPPPPRPFTEPVGSGGELSRAWLVLVDVASGASKVCVGEFAVHAYRPVWSRDGRWIVFASPFERRQIWLVDRDEAVLRRVPFRRQPPMPMLDLTGFSIEEPDEESGHPIESASEGRGGGWRGTTSPATAGG